MAFYTQLKNRSVLRLEGDDVETFLQGVITNDIKKLSKDTPLYTAILSPQGKYLFDFFLYLDGMSILLDCNKAQRDELWKKMRMYILRSRVKIEETALEVYAAWGCDITVSADALLAVDDPRDVALGKRILGKSEVNATEDDYDYLRIQHTVPETLKDLIPEKSFPLPSNMEEMNAIDYKKGCYVGQEVTARSKHRGVVRKQLYTLKADAPISIPAHTTITFDGIAIGEILSSNRELCIAQLEKEKMEGNPSLSCGGIILTRA